MQPTSETRYQKQKRIEAEKERHARIIAKLTGPINQRFAEAVEKIDPKCRRSEFPSPWTDWDSDPETREDYETARPNRNAAKALCAECPLSGEKNVCYRYATATGQFHGVWGGFRRENGRWVQGSE